MSDTIRLACRTLLVSLALAALPTAALAQRAVGGHIGAATSFVTFNPDDTTTIEDQFTLAMPIGVGVRLGDRVIFDFEVIVQNPIDPRGTTGLVVDPGVVFPMGAFALGLRVASAINAPANIGIIPLVNVGLGKLGEHATWFIEGAVPAFLHSDPDPDWTIDLVLHTGLAF
jgi:hypothetical protein